jgi:hypothetical protein
VLQQSKDAAEQQIRIVSLALWGGVFAFGVLGLLFLFNIIPTDAPYLIGGVMLVFAAIDVLVIKWLTAKMRRDAGL